MAGLTPEDGCDDLDLARHDRASRLPGTIAHRVCRHLARAGWLEGEGESAYLSDGAGGDEAIEALRMHSITYRIASGPQAGRKVATLRPLPADADALEGDACPKPSRSGRRLTRSGRDGNIVTQ